MKFTVKVTLYDEEFYQAQELADYYTSLETYHPWSIADVVDVAAKKRIEELHAEMLKRKSEAQQ